MAVTRTSNSSGITCECVANPRHPEPLALLFRYRNDMEWQHLPECVTDILSIVSMAGGAGFVMHCITTTFISPVRGCFVYANTRDIAGITVKS